MTRLRETEARLKKEFRDALNSKLGYSSSDDDFIRICCGDQTTYELSGENPFADLFADLSKAKFQKDFEAEAHAAFVAALCKESPDSPPEAVRAAMNYLFGKDFKVPENFDFSTERDDPYEELFRLLCWATSRRLENDEFQQWQTAREALRRRLPQRSLLRFVYAYLMAGRWNPNAWIPELVQWLVHDQDNAGMMKYISEWFNYSYRAPTTHDKTDFQLLAEHLRGYEEQLQDQWLVHVTRAVNELSRAWQGRGSGYADTVTEKGWKIYADAMEKCLYHARAAIELHPDWAGAYKPLLDDYGGNHLAEFKQLMKYRPDYSGAYVSFIWSLTPRWCGSHAQIVALARTCMETKLYDTAVPSIGFSVLGLVATDTPWVEWTRCYRQEWLYEPALALFDDRQARGFKRDIRLDKALFLMANFEYDAAAAIVKEVQGGDDAKKIAFVPWSGRGVGNWYPKVPVFDDAATRLRLFTGEHAAALRAMEQLAVTKQDCASAARRLRALIEARDDWSAEERNFLVDLYGRWRMPELKAEAYRHPLDEGYNNAFLVACGENYLKVAEEMVDLKFDYARYERYPGETAYQLAGRSALPEVMDVLKRAGDPLNRPTAEPKMQLDQPIHNAAHTPNPQMVRHLVELGVDPNAVNDHGHTIMHFFAAKSSIEGLKLGIELGCDPDARDADGDTAMMFLPQVQAHPECLRVLVAATKNIDISNHSGMTALHHAAQHGDDPEYINILLAAGADAQARTRSHLTAYDIALSRGRSDFVALLPKPDPNYVPKHRIQTTAPSPAAWSTVLIEFLKMPILYVVLACLALPLVFLLLKRKKKQQ